MSHDPLLRGGESARERSLQYENDELREQVEANDRRRERERREREEEATERRRAMLPSNRLYNGEIADAEEAIQAHVNALVMEDHGFDEPFATDWKGYIVSARQTLADYRERIKAARETYEAAERAIFEDFAKSDDETRKCIGEAGLAGDWSRLAV